MKKRNLFKLFLLLLILIPTSVLAGGKGDDKSDAEKTGDYVECWYGMIHYYYNRTSDTFTHGLDTTGITGQVRFSYTNTLIKSNFINSEKKLYCPDVYTELSQKGGAGEGTHKTVYSYKRSSTSTLEKPTKSNVHDESSSLNKQETCIYSTSNKQYKIEFVLDTDSKKILSAQVNAKIVTNNPFTYDEIWKDDKCVDIKEIYASCGSNGITESCGIFKETLSTPGSNSPQATLDKDTSTGGNNGDTPNYTPGKEVYGCEVVPEVVKKWIKLAANFVKYVALVLVIVLGTIDFIKAAGSGEPDAIKKAGQSFVKRVIAVIILFLLPMIIDLILNLINLYGSNGDCFDVLK